ncbi:MAG: hypothetical protein ACK5JT_09655 [Hyphomicrobiaceae bacterium]
MSLKIEAIMRKFLTLTTLLLGMFSACAAANLAAAQSDTQGGMAWMNDDEIKSQFSGRKLQGIYPSRKHWREEIFTNGTTDYTEGTKRWKGQWHVTNGSFCFRYPVPGTGGCFRVVQVSANCFELYELGTEHADTNAPPTTRDYWNGRMWHSDRKTTCEQTPSV